MSTWSERAHRAAEALDMEAIEATDPEDVQYGFREGARWQREALLADEAVERAARALVWETTSGGYTRADDQDRGIARQILTATIEGDQ